jgi:ribosomal-protein-alanine N-acetyltransferase
LKGTCHVQQRSTRDPQPGTRNPQPLAVHFQQAIRTQRLELRPFRIRDAVRVHQLLQDPQISQSTLRVPYPYLEGMAERWIATHQTIFYEDRGAVFAICLPEAEVIGVISLDLDRENQAAELGYWLGVGYWGQGYCTEAATALVRYGFEVLSCHRIHARRLESNSQSGRVLEKVGFRQEGRLLDAVFKEGGFRTVILHALINPQESSVAQTQ